MNARGRVEPLRLCEPARRVAEQACPAGTWCEPREWDEAGAVWRGSCR